MLAENDQQLNVDTRKVILTLKMSKEENAQEIEGRRLGG